MTHEEMMQFFLQGNTLLDARYNFKYRLHDGYIEMCSNRNPIWRQAPRIPMSKYLSAESKFITINGFPVPEPLQQTPEEGSECFMVDLYSANITYKSKWIANSVQVHALARGLLHLTEDSAKIHAKALISFTNLY